MSQKQVESHVNKLFYSLISGLNSETMFYYDNIITIT